MLLFPLVVKDCDSQCTGHGHLEDGAARNDFNCHNASPLDRVLKCIPTTTMDLQVLLCNRPNDMIHTFSFGPAYDLL